ncbi:hypothetical protein [Novosphingobium sp.]|uniref:hypothetical protein n=1 Tax=Novosphingobium sp. TaxID=1874826 RepID=UPI002637AF31|nr:hypothetical protein [Novosphingobium sp.]
MTDPFQIVTSLSVRQTNMSVNSLNSLNFDTKCRGGCILARQEPVDTPYGRLAAGTHCSKCGAFFRDEFQPGEPIN